MRWHLAVVGATRAHALIKALSTANAKAMPGVVEIYTGADAAKVCGPMPPTMDTFGIKLPRRMAIAFDKVVFFGEPVALVLAETPAQAEDAAAAVAVEYEDLPVTIDGEQSAAITDPADPRLLYPEWKTNLQIDYPFAIGDVDSIFASADLVVSDIIRSQRYGAQPMEARGVIAFYDSREGTLRVRASTQIPHQARMFFAAALSIPEFLIQILVGDVGGGFGAKLGVDAEYLPVIATRLLGRPVKWIEPRSSWIATAPQARDFVTRVRAAFDRDGKFKAMDVDVIGDMGCDGAERAGGLGMPVNGAVYAPGAYRLEAYRFRSRAVVTNKPPYGAYRGYGKDIANLAVERMMEKAALGLKMDPIEIRRRNLVDAYPYQLPSGPILENGSGRECLDRLLALMSPSELRAGQAEARGAGRYLGFGISSYIEPAGAAFPGSMFQNYEAASIWVNADGTVRVYTGMVSLGQGIETVYAQVAADLLGCRPTDVTVSWGDTDAGVFGSGTYSSRGAMYSVGALEKAAKLIRPRLMHVASKLLERPVGDLKLHDLIVTSKETNKSCTLKDIAYAVYFQPGAEIVLDGAELGLAGGDRKLPPSAGQLEIR